MNKLESISQRISVSLSAICFFFFYFGYRLRLSNSNCSDKVAVVTGTSATEGMLNSYIFLIILKNNCRNSLVPSTHFGKLLEEFS